MSPSKLSISTTFAETGKVGDLWYEGFSVRKNIHQVGCVLLSPRSRNSHSSLISERSAGSVSFPQPSNLANFRLINPTLRVYARLRVRLEVYSLRYNSPVLGVY